MCCLVFLQEGMDWSAVESTTTAFHSSQNVWDDGIILPKDTREVRYDSLSKQVTPIECI